MISYLIMSVVMGGAANAQSSDLVEQLRRQSDQEQRSANAQHDWWLVSTTGYDKAQHRFYIDREKMLSMEPESRAWVDHYAKGVSALVHEKWLVMTRCADSAPQILIKTAVSYQPNGDAKTVEGSTPWRDVIPETSQETLWRFICHSTPANAIVYVPDDPASDAARYYARTK